MKKSLVSILLAAALAGCSEDALVDSSTTNQGILNEMPTFTASVESEQGEGSRAILDGTTINWQKGDQLSIFNQSTAHLKYQLKGEGGSSTGTFQAVEAPAPAADQALDSRIAIYPYHEKNAAKAATATEGTAAGSYLLTYAFPATQHYTAGSFDPKAFPMVAVSETYDLAFRNVCGVLKLQFTGADKVRSITVTGNNNEVLAGLITTTFTPNGPSSDWTATEASKVVTLDCGEAGVQLSEAAPTTFHITLPPTTFTKGYTVKVKNTAGVTKTIRTTHEQVIQRNQILKMSVQHCEFTQAKLKKAAQIYNLLPADVTKLTFVPGSDLTGTADQLVSIDGSKAAAYIIPDESTTNDVTDYLIVTSADEFLFNADSHGMFEKREKLKSVIFDGCNTSQVTDMSRMFMDCTALTSLDLSGFDTSQVTNMSFMFNSCSVLATLNLNGFNTSQVTDMHCMFESCSVLATLNLNGFDTSLVTDMSRMFQNCYALGSLDLSTFDTSQVTNMHSMFESCSDLPSLDLSGFDTGKVTDMSRMFVYCNFSSLDVSGFNTSQVTDMHNMFYMCSSLTTLNLSNFNTSQVTNMSSMFSNCSSLTSLDVSGCDLSQVTDMANIFSSCKKLQKLDLSTLVKLPAATNVDVVSLFEKIGFNVETGAELILHKDMNFTGYNITSMFYKTKLKSLKCTPAMKEWILTNSKANDWKYAVLVEGFKWINLETNEEMN